MNNHFKMLIIDFVKAVQSIQHFWFSVVVLAPKE
jgi:hypothetical protein